MHIYAYIYAYIYIYIYSDMDLDILFLTETERLDDIPGSWYWEPSSSVSHSSKSLSYTRRESETTFEGFHGKHD